MTPYEHRYCARAIRVLPQVLIGLVLLTACGSERDGADGAGGDAMAGPVYALHVVAFDPDFNATSYVALTDTLDITRVPLESAREFPGWATIATVGGRLLVAGDGDPTITRYDITTDWQWREAGSLSFLNTGVMDAGFGRQWFLDEHTAYTELEITKRVVWDPTDFVIRGVMEDSALPLERDGFQLEPGLNRQVRLHRGPVLRPFYYWETANWLSYAPTSQIAVYDTVTHAERRVIDAPCPGLHVGTQDEEGNTYFGIWDALPKLALYGQGPPPCVARVTTEGTLDTEWTPDLTSWTGGRYVMVFRYVRNGKALANVLHHEELGVDLTGEYDEAVGDALDSGEHYRVWMFDLERHTAVPVEGLPKTSWGFHASDIDGRSFVFLPRDDYGRTQVFEVDMQTGSAIQRFETTGWVYEWVRVR